MLNIMAASDRHLLVSALKLARRIETKYMDSTQFCWLRGRRLCASSGDKDPDRIDIEVELPLRQSGPALHIGVWSKTLLRVLESMPAGDVRLSQRGSILEIYTDSMRVEIDGISQPRWELWEPAPLPATGTFYYANMRKKLERVLPAISVDDLRYNLNRVALDGGNIVATNGHWLAVAPWDLWPGDMTIYGHGVRAILDAPFDEHVSAKLIGEYIHLRSERMRMRIKNRQVTYVPWRQIFLEPLATARIPRMQAIGVMRQILGATTNDRAAVHMTINSSSMQLVHKDHESLAVVANLPIVGGPLDPVLIGFDARYMLHALETIGEHEDVYLGLVGEQDAMIISATKDNHEDSNVVMPMRI